MNFVKLFTIFAAITAVQSASCKNNMKLISNDFIREDDRLAILNYHNQVRRMVSLGTFYGQPKASPPLRNLRWDKNLADKAQKVTETCRIATVRQFSSDYNCIGQNIWAQTTHQYTFNQTIDWQLPISSWTNAVNNFVYPHYSKDGTSTSKYTQIVWSDTTDIGCAAVKFLDGHQYVYFVVCNYGPCGNIRGAPPYKI